MNVIESANGASLVFSDVALAQGIGEPIFTWGANLIDLAIKFFPVFLVIAFFWLMIGFVKNVGQQNKIKKDKDLENK